MSARGVLANCSGMWRWPAIVMRVGAFIADGGGDELLLIVGEGVGGDVAPRMMMSKADHSSRVSGEELGGFERGLVGGGFDGRLEVRCRGWRRGGGGRSGV